MTDYEAAFEDVMRYMPAVSDDVDSPEKLRRWLRRNDRNNTMTLKFLDRVSDTNAAQDVIQANQSSERQQKLSEVKTRQDQNRDRVRKDRRIARRNVGRSSKGTYTNKRGDRYNVFANKSGKDIYRDKRGNYREVKTGRFAIAN